MPPQSQAVPPPRAASGAAVEPDVGPPADRAGTGPHGPTARASHPASGAVAARCHTRRYRLGSSPDVAPAGPAVRAPAPGKASRADIRVPLCNSYLSLLVAPAQLFQADAQPVQSCRES